MVKKYSFLILVLLLIHSLSSKAQVNCQCWQTRDTSFHTVPFAWDSDGEDAPKPPLYRNDDGVTNPIVLPFNFCFYGKKIDTVFINNNGNVSFGQSYGSYVPASFPMNNYAMVAPFWGDVDTRNSTSATPSGVVWYKLTSDYLIVQWDSVGYYAGHVDKRNTFQLIMSDGKDPIIPYGNNVEFCYGDMQWTTGDASGGTNGFGGSPATVGTNEGDGVNFTQIGLFDTAGSKYIGEFPPGPSYDGVSWLTGQSFLFSTCSTGSLPPMVAGVSPCDTLILCMGDTTDLNISFLSPKAVDSTHAGLLPPVLSGVSILSNTPGNTVNMTLQIIGDAANYGIHDITVYGYDNESPPDTTFVTFVLEVDSTASGSIVASKDTICVGDSSKLKAVTNGISYAWSTGQTTDSIWVKPTVTTTYTLQVYKGKCPLILQKTIVVLNGGAITATKDSVCHGDSATLTVNNATSYLWSNGATTSTIKVKVDSTTIYKVVAKSACKTDTLSLKVTVIPVNITLSGNDSICVGNNTTLTASGGTSYLWSTGATTSSITVGPTVKTTYTVTVNNHGCIKDSTVTVVPSPKPTAGITVIPASDTICTGDSAMLIGSGGGSYVWPASGQITDTIWVKPGTTTTYFLEVTKGGCTATTSKQVVVIASAVASISLSQDSICPTDSATITATGGGTYKWLPPLSSTSSTVTVKAATTTTYSVVITRSCGVDTLTKTLHIEPFPKIIISHDTTICAGNGVTITASGGTKYTWSNGATTSSISVVPASTKTYTVVATNGRCSKDTTITVTVKNPPAVVISPNQKVCLGSGVTLTATATGATSYLWSNGATTSSITVTPTSTTTYVVTASNGCVTKDSATISVITPTLFACCDTTIVAGDTVSITASGSVNYVWAPNPSSLSCYTCPDPIASPTITTTYTVTSTDSAGCKDTKEVTVVVECTDFTVPNVFTPNNDGKNDDFVPFYTIGGVNYNGVGNVSSYSIDIYDRWGKKVYSSTDPTKYWNGTLNSTQYLVPDGVYYYIIKATCGGKNYDKKGFVQVLGGGGK